MDVKTERRKDRKTEIFFERCRRTYVLQNVYILVETLISMQNHKIQERNKDIL